MHIQNIKNGRDRSAMRGDLPHSDRTDRKHGAKQGAVSSNHAEDHKDSVWSKIRPICVQKSKACTVINT